MTLIKKISGYGISVLLLLVILLTSLILFPVAVLLWLVTAPFDKRRVVLHRFTCCCLWFWASIMPFWRISVEGRGKIDKAKRYVIAANHQSQLDIVMTALLFRHFKWVSKEEVLKIPIIGWQMALNRYITIRRGYVNSIAKMMTDCETALNDGSSVLLFPEGSRSETGEIQPFRPGAAILASGCNVSVMPVVIYGTKDALPKHSLFSIGIHRIIIKVLDEIPAETISSLPPEDASEMIRGTIEKHYRLIEKRLALDLYK